MASVVLELTFLLLGVTSGGMWTRVSSPQWHCYKNLKSQAFLLLTLCPCFHVGVYSWKHL